MTLPMIGPVRPCACGCRAPLYGFSWQTRHLPGHKLITKKRNRPEREKAYQRPARTYPHRRLCQECYGLARERGIDCACLRAEAAE